MTAAPTFAARLRGLPDPETSPECYDGTAFKRALAWTVDVMVIAVICALLVPFTAFLGLFFFPLMMMVVGFFYRWATITAGSATWGMRLMAIELRDGDDRPLDATQAFLHTAGYAVSVAIFPLQLVSMAMMLLTPHGQGLTDSVLATTALRRRR
ncbi:RDD family protein [Limimaricola hongkongensis]|uniref:RDD family protein n=1 Tax=Limimaricola hongkongensis TaxID=278132 RepID=UPI0003707396|nr:RDD family protein [Limimaricola hongkongensis]